MDKIKKYATGAWKVVVIMVAIAWASALVYGIYSDSAHALRYGLKLVVIAGVLFWLFDAEEE